MGIFPYQGIADYDALAGLLVAGIVLCVSKKRSEAIGRRRVAPDVVAHDTVCLHSPEDPIYGSRIRVTRSR